MNRNKSGKSEGRGAPIEDPQILQDTLRNLFEAEIEFSIKVEGTATLPYASLVQRLDFAEAAFVLKLVRPLPHELREGAQFRMLFAVDDQRFECIISLKGRDGYLQYSFQLPPCLILADRRRHKRYPFRPRENAYVIAQDAAIPGLGVAGPLVNVSLGGLALRVDRVLRMDTGVRVPVNSALFERGKAFTRFRVQDLPQLHLLEGRAIGAHVSDRGSELILGLTVVGLDLEEEAALARSLELREKMGRGGQPRSEGPAPPARSGRAAAEAEAEEPVAEPEPEPMAVSVQQLLIRRTARVVLAMAEGRVRQPLLDLLRSQGYHRLEVVDRLDQVPPLCAPGQRRALPSLILADLDLARSGDSEPLAAVRIIEGQLGDPAAIRIAILCEEVDPTLVLGQQTGISFLAYPTGQDDRWVELLDGLVTSPGRP